jgi:hypothetical protein
MVNEMEIDHQILVQFMAALLANPQVWDNSMPREALDNLLDTAIVARQKVLNHLDLQEQVRDKIPHGGELDILLGD